MSKFLQTFIQTFFLFWFTDVGVVLWLIAVAWLCRRFL